MQRSTGRYLVISSLILAIGIPSVAVGAGEGRELILGERNPKSNSLTRETEVIASGTTYGTRQSNVRDGDGGGAIYGCRSSLGNEPCIRANNLKGGRAFEFETTGAEAGRIETSNPSGAPFTTNANGVATGLNADAVDGRQGTDLLGRTEKAADADTLDGRESGSFASASDIRFARVSASGNGFVDNIQRGATGVAYQGNINAYDVQFDRSIARCAATVTPVGGENADKPSASAVPIEDRTFRVDFPDAPGQTQFYLQVTC